MDNVKNVMETIVEDELKRVLHQLDCCHCDECLSDILAISLNALPTRYVSTATGSLYAKANSLYRQNEADVLAAITRAAALVKENPRHSAS